MLQFFRKNQKFFFIIVTFFIVISFSFFGTFGTFTGGDEAPDREIGQLADGSILKEQRLQGMMRLLEHGIEEGGRMSNFLNGSAIHRDLILTGLGEILADHCFEAMEEELSAKWTRMKNFVPYVHPNSPHINARGVWGQMAPQISFLLDELKAAPNEFSKEQLPLMFKLYVAQADFPPPLLLQMLYYQQMQGQVQPDYGLPRANVGLFGFESIEDWFGSEFVTETTKFILNVASIAKGDGYEVKRDEAEVDLMRNVYSALKMFQQGEAPSGEDVQSAFVNQCRSLGLTQNIAIDHWRDVLLFRRLFNEVGEGVFLDRLAIEQFQSFAKPSLEICRYFLPRELHLSNVRDLLKFERYLEIGYTGNKMSLDLVQKNVEEVRDSHPEFVGKSFHIDVATVSRKEILSTISLKQTWDWEGEDANFAMLQSLFPALKDKQASTFGERMEVLDSLDDQKRFQVDEIARDVLLGMHPEWIDEALAKCEREEKAIMVRLKGGDSLFSGADFLALLETDDPKLENYSLDQTSFHSIRTIEKSAGWNLLPFEQLSRDGTLDESLDTLLQIAHEDLKFEESYEEVQDEVGKKVFADLFEAIGGVVERRFDHFLNEMRDLAKTDEEAFEKKQESLVWPLEKRTEMLAEDFGEEFSEVAKGSFYKVLGKKELEVPDEEVAKAKELLKRDAEKELMRKLLQRI